MTVMQAQRPQDSSAPMLVEDSGSGVNVSVAANRAKEALTVLLDALPIDSPDRPAILLALATSRLLLRENGAA